MAHVSKTVGYFDINNSKVDKEKVLKLIRENMYNVEYYFSDISEFIAEKLGFKKENKVYYYKTILGKDKVSKKIEELKLQNVNSFIDYIYDSMVEYTSKLCEEFVVYPENVTIVYKDYELYTYFHKKFFKYAYWFDVDKTVEEIFLYLQKNGKVCEMLNYGDFEKENRDFIRSIYAENIYHPSAEKMLERLVAKSEKVMDSYYYVYHTRNI